MDTKRIIADGFVSLLHSVSFENITTQMILDKSKVARSTFYRHFKDKYDVMTWYYQDYVDALIRQHNCDCEGFLKDIVIFIQSNQTYFKRVIATTGENSFFQFLNKYAKEYYKSIYINNLASPMWTEKDLFQITIIVEGCSAAIKQFIMDGCKADPDDLAKWTVELFPPVLKEIINK